MIFRSVLVSAPVADILHSALDASVTQSALEEALASKMQDGGTIGSRMSTISQAIRSRYMPKAPARRPDGA
jgi:hypothetical protein